MDRELLESLTTNHYKTLKALYERQAEKKGGQRVIAVTQREIAEELKVSKPTVVGIFRALSKSGLISKDAGTRGRYYMTEEGNWVVKCFEQVLKGRGRSI